MAKKIRFVAVIFIISIALSSCNMFYKERKVIFYPDPQDVVDVFIENTDDFQRISEILYKSPVFDNLSRHDRTILNPYREEEQLNEHLSEEEYDFVFYFFEKYGPHQISNDRDELCIVFLNGKGNCTNLYFIPPLDDRDDTIRYLGQRWECVKLIDDWYYSVHIYN